MVQITGKVTHLFGRLINGVFCSFLFCNLLFVKPCKIKDSEQAWVHNLDEKWIELRSILIQRVGYFQGWGHCCPIFKVKNSIAPNNEGFFRFSLEFTGPVLNWRLGKIKEILDCPWCLGPWLILKTQGTGSAGHVLYKLFALSNNLLGACCQVLAFACLAATATLSKEF